MSAEIVDLADKVLSSIDDWRHRATLFAFVNPMGFYVCNGCLLPEYLSKLNELESTFNKVKERCP